MSNLVYRVVDGGTRIQALRHVRSTANGWHRYRIEAPDPIAGNEFNTHTRYGCPTPMSAVLEQMQLAAAWMEMAIWSTSFIVPRQDPVSNDIAHATEAAKQHKALCRLAKKMATDAGLVPARDEVSA